MYVVCDVGCQSGISLCGMLYGSAWKFLPNATFACDGRFSVSACAHVEAEFV